MTIKIFGDTCATCKATIKAVEQAAQQIDNSIEVTISEDILEMVRFDIYKTPAIVIDGKVAAIGKGFNIESATKLINEYRQ